MTTYAIGSVKGDYQSLNELLATIEFDPNNDSLWFTGNLVNGGSESLEVLRFVKSLGYTLMSYCDETGKLVFNPNDDETGKLLEGLVPWYKLPDRNTTQLNIIFSDDANFEDITFPGIYPLSADRLSALKLTDHPQRI